jgi:hypothetical protein
MNPERKLHSAILDALKEFPGIERIVIQSNPEGIEVIFKHGGRGASRVFLFRNRSETDEEYLGVFLHRQFDEMARSVRPNHPGPGAAWSWSEKL